MTLGDLLKFLNDQVAQGNAGPETPVMLSHRGSPSEYLVAQVAFAVPWGDDAPYILITAKGDPIRK